jgi:mono/diheme cytochrome c family protein
VNFLRWFAALGLASTVATLLVTGSLSAQSGGVYTAAQAAAGAKLFSADCAQCHGQKLEGIAGPALAGKAFLDKWSGQTADDLHYVMSTQMPLTAPGSLKPDEYLDLVAYVLQQNGYAPGSDPLTAAKLKGIKIAPQSK